MLKKTAEKSFVRITLGLGVFFHICSCLIFTYDVMGFLTSYTHIAILLLNLTYDSFKCLNLIKHFKPVFKPGMNGDLCYTIITDCK